MTEQRFEELVNLYLDNEIGSLEVGELKHAIRTNVLRKRKFERACELHQAARKALAAKAAGGNSGGHGELSENAGSRGDGKSFQSMQSSTTSSSGRQSSRGATLGVQPGGKEALRHKQAQAQRNASVETMAERQSSKGAATEVDLSKVSLESNRSSQGVAGRKTYSFFDSPLGMFAALSLLALSGAVLYFSLQIYTDAVNAEGKESALHQSDVKVDKKIMRELSALPKPATADTTAAANEAMSVENKNPAPAPSSNTPRDSTDDLLATATDPASNVTAAPSLKLPAGVSSAPANGNSLRSLPQLVAPALPGGAMPPDSQAPWVNISMPTLPSGAQTTDTGTQNANSSIMPTVLP